MDRAKLLKIAAVAVAVLTATSLVTGQAAALLTQLLAFLGGTP